MEKTTSIFTPATKKYLEMDETAIRLSELLESLVLVAENDDLIHPSDLETSRIWVENIRKKTLEVIEAYAQEAKDQHVA